MLHRIEHLVRFYGLLEALERRIGGRRMLADCHGRMLWPQRGVYFFMEEGERRTDTGDGLRIVRVGTHALTPKSQTTLWNRLSQHKGQQASGGGNHRGSIFRLLVGSALLKPCGIACPTWGIGTSAPRAVRVTEQAAHHHRRSVEIITGDSLYERFGEPGLPAVFSRAYLAWGLAELGAFAEGRARSQEAMQIAETVTQPFTLSHACWGSGVLSLRKGDLPEAIITLERTLDVCRTGDVQLVLPWAASALGYAYALAGRLTEALPLLEQAASKSTAMKQMAYYPLWVTHLCEAYLLAGRLEEARQLGGQALTLARDLRQRGHEAYALRLLGEFGARGDSTDAEHAETSYHRALALAGELGMRPLVAHCHLGIGKLCRRTNKREQAQEHLTTATTMYREMGMTYRLEKAEAEMKAAG